MSRSTSFPFPFSSCPRGPAALALLCTLHAAAAAQAPPQSRLPVELQGLLHRASPIAAGAARPDGSDAGLWAAGADYKASFHDGFVFWPYVGSALPHQPLRWRTVAATLGGQSLLDGTPAGPRAAAFRCEYDLGDVVECYDVRDGGVEQTFVVERAGAGELVIRGAVETPLQLHAQAGEHGPLELVRDGKAVIGYGAATAVDAAGRRFAMTTASDGGSITLRLDAAAVGEAVFPLVVDPWISNALGTGAEVTDCDVLHETLTPIGSLARTWVAYGIAAAAGDEDVWVRRLGTAFVGTPIDTFREISAWDATHPRLALAPGANEVVLVFSTGPVGPNPLRLLAMHEHDVNDLFLRTSITSPFGVIGAQDWRPVVGGHPTTGSKVLVVWQRETAANFANTATSAVMAGVYDAATDSVTVPGFVVRNRPNRDQERPAVNRGAEGSEWLVAFQEHDGTVVNDDWDVIVSAIDNTGAVVDDVVALAPANVATLHATGPRLDGSGGRYCLLYTTQQFVLPNPKPQDVAGESLWAQRIDFDHATDTASLPHAAVELRSAQNPVLVPGGIAFDATSNSHWACQGRNVLQNDLVAYKLGYRGMVTESITGTPPAGATFDVGGVAFDALTRRFQFVFARNDGSANGNALMGGLLDYETVAAPAAYGFGCGPGTVGGLAAMADRQQIGAENLRFVLDNAPVNGVAFALLSLRGASVPLGAYGMPGCDLLIDPSAANYVGLLVAPVVAGRGTFDLDLIETLVPFRLAVQWFYPAPGANAAGLLASDAVAVEVGR